MAESSFFSRTAHLRRTGDEDIEQEAGGIQDKRSGVPRLRIDLPDIQATEDAKTKNVQEPHAIRNGSYDYLRFDRKSTCTTSNNESPTTPNEAKSRLHSFSNFHWIRSNLNLPHLKPVLRCAFAAWISMLLVVIPRSERVLGQSSFLLLVASFLSPPSDTFVAVVEREMTIQLFVVGTYAWSCLGIKAASLSRSQLVFDADMSDIVAGKYIERGSSLTCSLFLCIGTSILLYLRAFMGQGKPVIAAFILSFTALDSTLTSGALYPYPLYSSGKFVVIPVAIHSLISIISAFVVFPETVHSQFRGRFRAVCVPLSRALRGQPALLREPLCSRAGDLKKFHDDIWESEMALGPLLAIGRLMKKDVSYGRFGPNDFAMMHELARRLTVRANGMAFYFKILDPSRQNTYGAPRSAISATSSPLRSRSPSPRRSIRTPLPTPAALDEPRQSPAPSGTATPTSPRGRRHFNRQFHPHHIFHHPFFLHLHSPTHGLFNLHHHRHHSGSHGSSLFGLARENAVGVFESQRFLNLEARAHLTHPDGDILLERMQNLLSNSASELLVCCADTLEHVDEWLKFVPTRRVVEMMTFSFKRRRPRKEALADNDRVRDRLERTLGEFRDVKRHCVLDPYRSQHNPKELSISPDEDIPPHRYLFQCYLYQYHLMQMAMHLLEMVNEIDRLENSRQPRRFWLPAFSVRNIFAWKTWEPSDTNVGNDEDEDPDTVIGIDPRIQVGVGEAQRRDPDALPPSNIVEAIGSMIYFALEALRGGHVQFAIKAGIFAALISLPSFLVSSATFALKYRYIWAIVLGQTTLSRFRGDTIFGLIARIMSTFFGGIVGMLVWYISTGKGSGSAFGLAATTAVVFPFLSFVRIYFPGPPIIPVFFTLTAQLVIGYSWQDSHYPSISAAGWGFSVAWRRFLLVAIGVTFASLFSFLPPSKTIRRHLRTTYATTVNQIGHLYCEVISHVMVCNEEKTSEITRSLGAIRMKLNRSRNLSRNVVYEYPLRGKWPARRYRKILELQMEVAYLLSHLRVVTERLDLEWSKAFLRRTRFLESDFQGDVLAVLCLISTALRTGMPLPQVTPCPLLDRFISQHPGLNVLRVELEDDYGLPRNLTIDTLENEQYLYFSVGAATAFGIVTRLDSLMLATKELVGEQYHIRGLPLVWPTKKEPCP